MQGFWVSFFFFAPLPLCAFAVKRVDLDNRYNPAGLSRGNATAGQRFGKSHRHTCEQQAGMAGVLDGWPAHSASCWRRLFVCHMNP